MTALAWCGLLVDIDLKRTNKIKLDDVKGSCERFMAYCSKIESFCKSLSFMEISLSLIIFLWSCFRCNPVLLKLIIGSKSIRQQQPSLQPVFDTAKALRGSSKLSTFEHGPTLLFNIICYINIILLTIDILFSIYLWIKIRKEVLFLHFESKDIASVEIRNIMISLAVTPMSAFCVSRYSYFNKYIASNKLNDALESVHLITKTTQNTMDDKEDTDDIDDEVDIKEQQSEIEREALYVLDSCLTKTKPFDMKDMEDVLELMVPTFILWNLNIYLLYAGITYLYIYCIIFIVSMFLIIWFKFSKNIGMITPLLLPLTCIMMEFFAFIVLATLSLLWHHQSPIAALFIAPLIILSVATLFWKKKGSIHSE